MVILLSFYFSTQQDTERLSVTAPFVPSSHIASYSDTANSHNALLQHMVLLEQSAPLSPLVAGEFLSFSKHLLCVLILSPQNKKVAPNVCQGCCLTIT